LNFYGRRSDLQSSLDVHARVSLFEEADDLLIGTSGLFHSRYSPKLADFVPSLCYGREGVGNNRGLNLIKAGRIKGHLLLQI
jgi:hypothetical protein